MFGFSELRDFPKRVKRFYDSNYIQKILDTFANLFSSTHGHDLLLTVKISIIKASLAAVFNIIYIILIFI